MYASGIISSTFLSSPYRIALLGLSVVVGISLAQQPSRQIRFRVKLLTTDLDVSVHFFDKIRGAPPRFVSPDKSCFSVSGEGCQEDSPVFVGAYAIVHFELRPRRFQTMRERVRLIDQEEHLPNRPAFEKTLNLVDGTASDIQLFGYEVNAPPNRAADPAWRYFRQELFLGEDQVPFLILHWKHTVNEITLIDAIPVGGH